MNDGKMGATKDSPFKFLCCQKKEIRTLAVHERNTGCPKINFTFLNVNNVRTNIPIATPAVYIDRGDL